MAVLVNFYSVSFTNQCGIGILLHFCWCMDLQLQNNLLNNKLIKLIK